MCLNYTFSVKIIYQRSAFSFMRKTCCQFMSPSERSPFMANAFIFRNDEARDSNGHNTCNERTFKSLSLTIPLRLQIVSTCLYKKGSRFMENFTL